MKLLSIAVPCYNSQEYMRNCLDSILIAEDIEVIIVDDGSKDDTLSIAQEYQARYPDVVRVVHQENGGHGCAVMTGLRNASGKYFRVVDSDDWLDADAFPKVLDALRDLEAKGRTVDLFMTNYIYDKVGAKHKKVISYANAVKPGRVLTWDQVGKFHVGQYILMHATTYRREMLLNSGMDLPKHTFYVDNIYVYQPMSCVQNLYYLDVDLYHYYIGRADQSVHEDVMIRRIDQQLRVNRIMMDEVDLKTVAPKRKQDYMLGYMEIITIISSVLLLRSGTEEAYEKKRALWAYMEENHPDLYRKLRNRIMGRLVNLRGKVGRRIVLIAYSISQKVVGFN